MPLWLGMLAVAIPDTLATQEPQRAALYTRMAILLAAESLSNGVAYPMRVVLRAEFEWSIKGRERKSSCNTGFTGRSWNGA